MRFLSAGPLMISEYFIIQFIYIGAFVISYHLYGISGSIDISVSGGIH